MFIFLFLFLLIIEGLLGLYVYRQTGEISTFQIVIIIFIIYAFTFGILDFIKGCVKKLESYVALNY